MDKIHKIINQIKPVNCRVMDRAQKRLDNLTKPLGSLGRLEELARRIAGITGKENPSLKNKVIFTMAADHGIAEEGVSAYPQDVTAQMVRNFLNGGAAINVLAGHVGAKVVVVDMGVSSKFSQRDPFGKVQSSKFKTQNCRFIDKKINYGTNNFTKGPAMTREEAVRSVEAGMEVFEEENRKLKIDIAGTGDMGIGNTTPSSAITAVFTKAKVADVTGRGTGLDDKALNHKVEMIEKGIGVNNPDSKDAMDVLARVGGFEIGGLAGVMLAGAAAKIPVVIDGFISGAAALVACGLEPKVKDYLVASHCSVEKGHRILLNHLGLKPLFDLDMRLGEGTGAALGINLAEASVKILNEMASFESAGVSQK